MNANTAAIDSYLSGLPPQQNLSKEYEADLARKVLGRGDKSAENQLVSSQLRFVVHIARGYSGYGLGVADLVQEGNMGLTKAVRRFNPDKGVRLTTYASYSIHAEIREYIIKNWRIVKVATTKDQRKLFFKLRSAKVKSGSFRHGEIRELAENLSVERASVAEMEFRMTGYDKSFDAPIGQSEDAVELAPVDILFSVEDDPYVLAERSSSDSKTARDLHIGLAALDECSRDVLNARWLHADNDSLRTIKEKYGLSTERVRQIEQSAIKKLRLAFSAGNSS